MKKFLEDQKQSFIDRGTPYMVDVIDEIIAGEYKTFDQLIKEYKEKRDENDKYSIKFQYYWSIITFLVDMQSRYVTEYISKGKRISKINKAKPVAITGNGRGYYW